MVRQLQGWLLFVGFRLILATNEEDLPICPSNLQYFPQQLPMHCRMPNTNIQRQNIPTMSPAFYRSPPPDKQPNPIPIQIPQFSNPGMPGIPGMPGPMPGMMPMPMPMPVPMVSGQPHKMPVIVMPFYSPDHSYRRPKDNKNDKDKKEKDEDKHKHDSDKEVETDADTDTDASTDVSSSDDSDGYWKGRRRSNTRNTHNTHRRHSRRNGRSGRPGRGGRRHNQVMDSSRKSALLTPILQYVTKDGYVIFEKQISKNEAKDWLGPKNNEQAVQEASFVAKFKEVPKSGEDHTKIVFQNVQEKHESKEDSHQKPPPKLKRKHKPTKVSNLMNKPGPTP